MEYEFLAVMGLLEPLILILEILVEKLLRTLAPKELASNYPL